MPLACAMVLKQEIDAELVMATRSNADELAIAVKNDKVWMVTF